MSIRSDMHGRGLGVAILNWASAQLRQNRRRYLRLECQDSNKHLRSYYEDQGFVYKGQFKDREYVAALYERTI